MMKVLEIDKNDQAGYEDALKLLNEKFSDDFHKQSTPFELCEEVILKVGENVQENKKWLVIANLEFLIVLKYYFKFKGWKFDNVYFASPCKAKRKRATKLGVKEVISYDYKNIKKWTMEGEEKVKKFDVIIGNPPYQGKKSGGGDGSGNPIWQKFVIKAFELCEENGYIALVHPSGWRFGPRAKIQKAQELLFSKQMNFLKMQFPFPGAGAVCDYYVCQNSKSSQNTYCEFIDKKEEFKISGEIRYINHYNGDMISNILSKVFKTENNGIFYRQSWGGLTILDESKPIGNYPLAHGSGYTKNEFKYANYPHIHQNNQKVIVSAVRKLRPIFDNGVLGIGDHVHYILVKNEQQGNFLTKVFNSILMNFIQGVFAQTFWDPKASSQWNNAFPLGKILPEDIEINSDIDILNHYQLNQEERNFILTFMGLKDFEIA